MSYTVHTVHIPDRYIPDRYGFQQVPPKMLVTILGEEDDHPVFHHGPYARSIGVNEQVRRIDLEINKCLLGSELRLVDYRCIEPGEIVHHAFHSCGGIFDLRDVKLELGDKIKALTTDFRNSYEAAGWLYRDGQLENQEELESERRRIVREDNTARDTLSVNVRKLSCTRCKKTVNVSDVFYDMSGIDSVGHALGATGTKETTLLRIGYSDQDTDLYSTLIDNVLILRSFPASFLDEIYYGVIHERHSLESLLERLFPNVPASVMEKFLRDFTEKLNVEISDLERKVSVGTFGKSTAEAVVSFTFGDDDSRYIFKIMKNKKTADKEVLILTEAQKSLRLALYLPRLSVEEPLAYNGYHLIAMEHLRGKTPLKDDYKDAACRFVHERGKAVPEKLMHRFYVISLFHTALSRLAGHPLLSYNEAPRYYYPCQSLEESLLEYPEAKKMGLKIEEQYNTAVAYRLAYNHKEGLVVHGDTVQRNWVFQHLIDFGSACAADSGGGIQRDIARIILSTITPEELHPEFMKQCVDCYYAFRDFEEQSTKVARTEQGMKIEYAHFFAELEVEAYRRLRTLGKRLPPSYFIPELERHISIAKFAGREFKEYLKV